MNNYYVYGYYYGNHIPFYIGKGTSDRISIHLRNRKYSYFSKLPFYRKLNKLIKNNIPFYYKIIRGNLSEKESYIVEEILISMIGRTFNKTGTLYNLSTGGGSCGISDIHHKKVSIYNMDNLKLYKSFESVQSCASFLNVHPANISNYFKKRIPIGTDRKYFINYYKDVPESYYTLERFENKMKQSSHYDYLKIKLKLININTNQILYFNSIKEFCTYFKACVKTVKRVINNKGIYKKEWKIYYD